MSGKDPLSSHNLKQQLQAKNARHRSSHHAQTRLVTAVHGRGRNDLQPALATVSRSPRALQPSATRTRETTAQLLESTVRSIKKFGMVLPVLIDGQDVIVAGHAVWEAAIQLGFETIECRVVEHLDPIGRDFRTGRHQGTGRSLRQASRGRKRYRSWGTDNNPEAHGSQNPSAPRW